LDTLKRLGWRDESLEREVPKMVRDGLQRIYDEQNDDGGWGWFKGEETHRFMTAYVVYGLALAKQAGFEVEQERMERALRALWQLLRAEEDRALQAYMLFALTEAKKAWGKLAGSDAEMRKVAQRLLKASRQPLPPMAQAALTMALHRLGEKEGAQRSLMALAKQARLVDGLCWWEGSWGVLGESEVEATAYALKAFLALQPDDPKVQRAVLWLTQQRTGNFWYATKSTAAALFALTDYLSHFRELQADYTLKVFVNGDLLREQPITAEHATESWDGTASLYRPPSQFRHEGLDESGRQRIDRSAPLLGQGCERQMGAAGGERPPWDGSRRPFDRDGETQLGVCHGGRPAAVGMGSRPAARRCPRRGGRVAQRLVDKGGNS
jgi:uncharacterized protein YfaS (alpha-2-macroglobulin family)